MTAMEAALRLVRMGVIEVRADGTIWKVRNLNHSPIAEPRRVETLAKNGYLLVKVCLESRQFLVLAHRLVWEALRGTIPDGLEINHKDGVTTHNNPDNLELATGRENMLHSYRVLGRKPPRSIPRPILKDVASAAKELRAKGLSFASIAKELRVSQTTAFRATRM